MIRYLLFLSIMTTASTSFSFLGSGGGSLVGNGGDAIICKDAQGQIKEAYFFDIYEAKEKFQMTIVPPVGNTLDEKVHNLIDRVSRIDPMRAWVMKKWYASFKQESFFKSGIKLVDVPDTGDAFWPQGCDLAQLVVQTEIDLPLKPYRYIFSDDIWKILDDQNKAATIIHELLWREARMASHKTSAAIRYFNGLFQSDAFKLMSAEQYDALLDKLDLRISTTQDGYPVGSAWLFDGLEFTNEYGTFRIDSSKGDHTGFQMSNGFSYSDFGDYIVSLKLPQGLIHVPTERDIFQMYGRHGVEASGQFRVSEFNFTADRAKFNQETQTWRVSTNQYCGFMLEFYKDRPRSAKICLSRHDHFDDENKTVIVDYEALKFKDNKLVSFTSKSNFVYKSPNDNIPCRGKYRVDVYYGQYLRSCVLTKDIRIYQNQRWMVARAGKRVYINRNNELSYEDRGF